MIFDKIWKIKQIFLITNILMISFYNCFLFVEIFEIISFVKLVFNQMKVDSGHLHRLYVSILQKAHAKLFFKATLVLLKNGVDS